VCGRLRYRGQVVIGTIVDMLKEEHIVGLNLQGCIVREDSLRKGKIIIWKMKGPKRVRETKVNNFWKE
jgi:hypothetical protein